MKATRRAAGEADSDEGTSTSRAAAGAEEQAEPEAGEAHPAAAGFLQDDDAADGTAVTAVSTKASRGEGQEVGAHAELGDGAQTSETRGQMLQRHKRVRA